jgi:hypothetical protein
MRAQEFATEALDQPYPVSFQETEYGDVDASVQLPDGTYLNIAFNLEENDDGEETVVVRFDRGGSEEITGAGDAQRVFATVLSAIQEYITDYQPLRVNFSATKKVEPKQKAASRFKLYDRMVQRYARAWGYRSFRADNGELVTYELSKLNRGVSEVLNKTTAQLGPQLYAPHPKNLDESMKPRNALWTSTASGDNNGYTSAWVQWAESEMPQWIGRSGFLYDVSPSARILTINSDQDALIVAKKYGLNTTNVMDLFMYMPWDKIAKDYDAIHHVPSDRGADLFMHAWDVESTAWFNTNMLLNKRKVPIATSKTDLTEGKLSVDVPNEDWLQEKIDYAKSKGRNSYGVPHFGSTTASIRGTPLKARVMRLASLPGMRNEQMNVRKDDLKWLMDYMDTHKKLPPMGSRSDEEYLPYIMVAYNGEAWVNEGNHRIMAAYRLNWQTMPIEINYFDGGERIESGPMYPGKIGLE